MPLGNYTSQFLSNVYLNDFDHFVKHGLKAKYYIRYVDDFVILHNSKPQLEEWKLDIDNFLKEKLKLELHPEKSKIYNLKNGVNFLGVRIFYHHKLLKESNIKNFEKKFNQLKILYNESFVKREKIIEFLKGWLAYASHTNTFKFRKHILQNFSKNFPVIIKTTNKNQSNFLKKVNESELKFSVQKTLFLFNKGFSIKEIVEKRKIKESTVWLHLANLIEHSQLHISSILSKNKIIKILYKIYNKKDSLKEIKKRLKDDSITYDEINCVLVSVKRKKF